MNLWSAYLVSSSVVMSSMISLWLCSVVLKDASIVDRFWGLGFVLISWALALLSEEYCSSQTMLLVLVTIWGLRLSLYIHLRNQGRPEDFRYQAMRSKHGKNFWWLSFFSVFLIQGAIMLVVAAPLIVVLSKSPAEADPNYCAWSALFGSIVWCIGFIFEAFGDWELARFKRNPDNHGKLLTTGLWSLTRHPNYFGDACQWWGFGIFALAYIPEGLYALIGPLVMTILIRKVSGVDLLEKNLRDQKPGFAEYTAKVPAFFPRLNFWKKI